jgi:hypothetical protein
MAQPDFGKTKFPRRGSSAAAVTLAVLGFVLLMTLLFLFLKREPNQQHDTQPDRPKSSRLILDQEYRA